ncbi:MAG: Gfo/Idh/MocA family oxidoreductase [Bacilli bacterium]|nr:Gfo/Idh/MocA family oxidoreductase [Bacilli bacterium]
MTYKFALIGLGTIAKRYYLGLKESPVLDLVGVCDKSEESKSRALYSAYPYFKSYRDMIANTKPDFVLDATPPATHFNIGKDVLNLGCNLLIEKPATTSHQDFLELINIAKEKNLLIDIIFHWNYGSEVLYLQDKIKELPQIERIKTNINDPYYDNNRIKPDKVGLEGTWLDSGVNALSMISTLVELKNVKVLDKRYLIDPLCNLPYYSDHRFNINGVDVEIEVNWDTPLNKKITYIWFKNKDTMIIAHTEQKVYYNSQLIYDGSQLERLTTHYKNFFALFNKDKINLDKTVKIHKLLFSLK